MKIQSNTIYKYPIFKKHNSTKLPKVERYKSIKQHIVQPKNNRYRSNQEATYGKGRRPRTTIIFIIMTIYITETGPYRPVVRQPTSETLLSDSLC